MINNMCDGSGSCDPGQVRVLPIGATPDQGNMILCRSCFNREIEYRIGRNYGLGKFAQFKLPIWTDCAVYGEEVAR